VEKVELRSKQTTGGSEMGHLLLSHPISKSFTKYGKEDVFEVVPHIEVLNHLGVGFCQTLWGGHVNFIDLCQTGNPRTN
jgi:hypothetical protein